MGHLAFLVILKTVKSEFVLDVFFNTFDDDKKLKNNSNCCTKFGIIAHKNNIYLRQLSQSCIITREQEKKAMESDAIKRKRNSFLE